MNSPAKAGSEATRMPPAVFRLAAARPKLALGLVIVIILVLRAAL